MHALSEKIYKKLAVLNLGSVIICITMVEVSTISCPVVLFQSDPSPKASSVGNFIGHYRNIKR